MSSSNSLSNKKGISFDIVVVIVYVLIFIFINICQGKLDGSTTENSAVLLGICAHLLLLFSSFVVVAAPKFGYYAAITLNVLSAIRLIIVFIRELVTGSPLTAAVTGIISTTTSAILITIIFVFYRRVIKNNSELIKANDTLREKDEKLTYLAYYDILTGLPNRQLFIEKIDEAINLKANAPFTVISANIDNFKNINNDFGNNAGDAILISFSKKLKKLCGNSIFLARINGDEFGFILYGKESENTIINYLDTIKEVISEPIIFQDKRIHTTMSFGIALYPLNATDSTEMLKCVNGALTTSKFNGKNTYTFFNNAPSANYPQ